MAEDDLDATIPAREREHRSLRYLIETIVVSLLAQFPGHPRPGFGRTGWYAPVVHRKVTQRRGFQFPLRPGHARDGQVGVEAETQRYRGRRRGRHGGLDGQRPIGQCDIECYDVREREAGQQPRLAAVVKVGGEPVLGVLDQPTGIGRQHAMDHQTVLVGTHAAHARGQRDRATVDAVAVCAQTVCPRVQNRDPHGLAGSEIGLQTATLTQQLDAAIGKRRAHHSRRRYESGGEVGRRILQDDRGQLGHCRIVPWMTRA